jgi:hypothetical protein
MIRCNRSAPALLVLLAMPGYTAEPLPRVFFDATARSFIVAHRAGATPSRAPASEAVESGGTPTTASRQLRLDGIAAAATGTQFAWINGQRYPQGARLGAWQLEITRQGIILRGAGARRLLRVGESITIRGPGP